MNSEQWQQAKRLFDLALEQEPEHRPSFLRSACGDNSALLAEVESMLSLDAEADKSLINPFFARLAERAGNSLPEGRQIGHYRVIRKIGEGGMGDVYLAERADEQFRRRVAIKLIRPDFVDPRTLRRFHNERNTLAALDHPNIVRLLDAGTAEDGMPYLVMDYVEGEPITKYCEACECSPQEIVRLFRAVCAAVHYAHQSLVVHRDLKPGNILVTPEGTPKLLDFGIAKLLKPEYGAQMMGLTRTEAQPRTPQYASPEQVRGAPVTTASDVYSLGVLLYELLAGLHPFASDSASTGELEYAICHTDPPRPGAGHDLDTIVLTAMRKEPQRRYASAEHLSEDLRRWLDGLPVLARGDSVRYRLSKFVQRRKGVAAAVALLTLGLLASTAVSVRYAAAARTEKALAERRFREVRQIAHFVLFNLDEAIRSGPTPARKLAVTHALDYLNRLAAEAGDNDSLQKDVIEGYYRVGDIQGNPFTPNLGDPASARQSYTKGLELARALSGRNPDGIRFAAVGQRKLGEVMALDGNTADALKSFRAALELVRPLSGNDARNESMSLYERLGSAQYLMGELDGALDSYQRFLALCSDLPPGSALSLRNQAKANEKIGQILARRGDTSGATARIRTSLDLQKQLLTATPRDAVALRSLATTYAILADVYQHSNREAEALNAYRDSLDILDSLCRQDPDNFQLQRDRYRTLGFLAEVVYGAGRREEAHKLTADSLAAVRQLADRPESSWYDHRYFAWLSLTTPFQDLRDSTAARLHAERAAAMTGGTDPGVLDTLALAYEADGDFARATETEEKALSLPATRSNEHMRRGLEASLARFKKKLTPMRQQ